MRPLQHGLRPVLPRIGSQVLPDPNAGPVADSCKITTQDNDEDAGLAGQIAALFDAYMDVMPFGRDVA